MIAGVVIAVAACPSVADAAVPAGSSPAHIVVHRGAGTPHHLPDHQGDRCFQGSASRGVGRMCVRLYPANVPPPHADRARRLRAAALAGRAPTAAALPGSVHALDAASPPAQCAFGSFTDVHQADRLTSCTDYYWELYTQTTVDGTVEITGELFFEDLQYVTDVPNQLSPGWRHGLIISPYYGWGTLEAGVPVSLTSGCELSNGTCDIDPGGGPGGPFDAVPGASWSREWSEYDGLNILNPNVEDILDPDLGVQISGDGPFNPWTYDEVGYGLSSRCDSVVGSMAGCVNENFVPTLTYDATSNPLVGPVASHIYTAQTAPTSGGGLVTRWGIPPTSLHRDMNSADQAANNRAACANVATNPGVTNCDEFPMASTYEGAAFQSDFSAVAVPVSANNSQGGLTSSFYNSERVLDGDAFYVRAVTANGSSSW